MKTAFRQFKETYCDFSKTERNAVFVFIALIGILIVMPFLWPLWVSPVADKAKIDNDLRMLLQQQAETRKAGHYSDADTAKNHQSVTAFFAFDPNTISADSLRMLGFRPWLAERTIKYRKRFGPFANKADLQVIYGMDTNLLNRLEPYMHFSAPAKSKPEMETIKRFQTSLVVIELNAADTADLIRLPGIGPAFARRIIRYRSLLGGYYKTDQLLEVYGFDQAKYDLIKDKVRTDAALVKRIAVNTVTAQELRHPYLTMQQARAIISYRQQHGLYGNADDLLKVRIITPDIISKLTPYLSFTNF